MKKALESFELSSACKSKITVIISLRTAVRDERL